LEFIQTPENLTQDPDVLSFSLHYEVSSIFIVLRETLGCRNRYSRLETLDILSVVVAKLYDGFKHIMCRMTLHNFKLAYVITLLIIQTVYDIILI